MSRPAVGEAPSPHFEPTRIAPDTFVIRATHGEGRAPVGGVTPLAMHVNAMVIRGAEPIVVDTGAPLHRAQFLDHLWSIVDPDDVRWVFVSHDDGDHWGNLDAVMSACPNATVLTNWFMTERLALEHLEVPPPRWRWLADGERFDAGDRVLAAIRPPLYDSPTTRGLFDTTTGVYWAADCYATPVPSGCEYVTDLDPGFWADGFTRAQTWNSPWVSLTDPDRFTAECRRIEDLGVTTIATAHGPTIGAASVGRAFEMLRALPATAQPPQPGQAVLDEIIAQLLDDHV